MHKIERSKYGVQLKSIGRFFLGISLIFIFGQTHAQHYLPVGCKHPEFPKIRDHETVTLHSGYSLVYNEKHEQASWVAYILTKKETQGTAKRGDRFIEDPNISTGSATNADYSKSGYDRGHLAPAADMKWSEKVMAESFFFSNMSPQVPSFNRGIWKKLEEKVRDWAICYDSVLVITGPILENGLPTIGKNEVSIPKYYYKALIDYKHEKSKAIAFIIPNSGSKDPLKKFICSIDELELRTGIDFFYQFEDHLENTLEKQKCPTCWGL
ncbi:MAG: DNA/RNA non-specific endonuclease [Crocinitomicaceae bacterium]